jgi:hypothetical protein
MRRALMVAAFGLSTVCLAGPAMSQDVALPDGPAKDKLVTACSACHAITMVTSQRRSTAQWADTVDQMIARGAQVSDDDYKLIVEYLGKNFAPLPAAAPAAAASATPAKH